MEFTVSRNLWPELSIDCSEGFLKELAELGTTRRSLKATILDFIYGVGVVGQGHLGLNVKV